MSGTIFVLSKDRELRKRLRVSSPNSFDVDIKFLRSLTNVNRALAAQHTVRAVVIDCEMPLAPSKTEVRTLQTTAPQLPVIFIGADTEHVRRLAHDKYGVHDYIAKQTLETSVLHEVADAIIHKSRRPLAANGDAQTAWRILNSIGDAVISTDSCWRIVYLNLRAEELLGWTGADALGRKLTDVLCVIDGGTRERIALQLENPKRHGRTIILPPNCILSRRDGRELHIEDSASPIVGEDGLIAGMVVVLRDVGESRAMTQKMIHLAKHDVLTGLPNRALLDDRLEEGIALAHRNHRQLAVLFIDLDHFKHINDSLGHLIGDQLLTAVANRITPCVRQSDTVSRQGGDEFIVLLTEMKREEDAARIADKIRAAIMEPYTIENHYIHLSASIGMSVYPGDTNEVEVLIQYADTAMYHAKEKGRNRSQFFREDMNVHAAERHTITGDLRHALARSEFELRYQPKINLKSGLITGVEALIRWRHPSRGLMLPDQFIPIAEDNGLIIPIGKWVLRQACLQAQRWHDSGVRFQSISVNVSAVEFRNDEFLETLCEILRSTGLAPTLLELELTETAVMRNVEKTNAALQELSSMGIRIAVDDFGTGYSNLSYLKRFPIDTLKLDKSFVRDIPASADASTIVRSVIQMARSLHLNVVAEGIENLDHLKFLNLHECGEGQGFFFSEPVEAAEVEALISEKPFAMSSLQRHVAWLLKNKAAYEMPVTASMLEGIDLGDAGGPSQHSHQSSRSSFIEGSAAARQVLLVRATQDSPVAVVITDVRGLIVWVNKAFTVICGYTLEEAVGRVAGRLLQGVATDRREASRMTEALRRKQSVNATLVNYSKDARPYWIDIAIDPLMDPYGRVDAFIAYSMDTTSRRHRLSNTDVAQPATSEPSRAGTG